MKQGYFFQHGPDLTVESGVFRGLPAKLATAGFQRVSVVTGGRSVRGREDWSIFLDGMLESKIDFVELTVRGEPSPQIVDEARDQILRDLPGCDLVVAVGGGSVIDAAKAIAALLGMESRLSIQDYLEGVGSREPDGRTVSVYAFPTTAGTGSEATRNAVISLVGEGGFKKSLRHENFVPQRAYIDPVLHLVCPARVGVPSGLDAITQLLESYVSTAANPASDALALHGLRLAGTVFPRLIAGDDGEDLRAGMALAAFFSGRTLANVGLGLVHGIASPMGALRDIPHGVVCGLLVAPVSRATVNWARESGETAVLRRYAEAARATSVDSDLDDIETIDRFLSRLEKWAEDLGRLSDFGFTENDIVTIAAQSGLKNNPGTFSLERITEMMMEVF